MCYTLSRKGSKSRIDYFLTSNIISSEIEKLSINHFPFSDHDAVSIKIKTCVVERTGSLEVKYQHTFRHSIYQSNRGVLVCLVT